MEENQVIEAEESSAPQADDDDAEIAALYDQMTGRAAPEPEAEPAEEPKAADEPAADGSAEDDALAADKAAEQQASQAQQTDPFAGLPDEAKQQLQQIIAQNQYLHQFRLSQQGREKAYQDKIRELEERANAPQQQTLDVSDALAKFAEEMDDIAPGAGDKLREVLSPLIEEVQAIRGFRTETSQREMQVVAMREQQAALHALQTQHPDAREVVNSQAFGQWIETMPASIRGLVQSNDPADASFLLSQFKRDYTLAKQAKESVQTGRQRKLENSVGVGARAAGAVTESDDAEIARLYEQMRMIGPKKR